MMVSWEDTRLPLSAHVETMHTATDIMDMAMVDTVMDMVVMDMEVTDTDMEVSDMVMEVMVMEVSDMPMEVSAMATDMEVMAMDMEAMEAMEPISRYNICCASLCSTSWNPWLFANCER